MDRSGYRTAINHLECWYRSIYNISIRSNIQTKFSGRPGDLPWRAARAAHSTAGVISSTGVCPSFGGATASYRPCLCDTYWLYGDGRNMRSYSNWTNYVNGACSDHPVRMGDSFARNFVRRTWSPYPRTDGQCRTQRRSTCSSTAARPTTDHTSQSLRHQQPCRTSNGTGGSRSQRRTTDAQDRQSGDQPAGFTVINTLLARGTRRFRPVKLRDIPQPAQTSPITDRQRHLPLPASATA